MLFEKVVGEARQFDEFLVAGAVCRLIVEIYAGLYAPRTSCLLLWDGVVYTRKVERE